MQLQPHMLPRQPAVQELDTARKLNPAPLAGEERFQRRPLSDCFVTVGIDRVRSGPVSYQLTSIVAPAGVTGCTIHSLLTETGCLDKYPVCGWREQGLEIETVELQQLDRLPHVIHRRLDRIDSRYRRRSKLDRPSLRVTFERGHTLADEPSAIILQSHIHGSPLYCCSAAAEPPDSRSFCRAWRCGGMWRQ